MKLLKIDYNLTRIVDCNKVKVTMPLFDSNLRIPPLDIALSNSESSSESSHNMHLDDGLESDDEMETDDVERVYLFDMDFMDSPKIHGTYYIARYDLHKKEKEWLLASCISKEAFFHFPYQIIRNYLYDFSIEGCAVNDIGIIQLDIDPVYQVYRVIVKMFWLRIIQRTWKRIFKKRQIAIVQRRSLLAQHYFELHGRYPYPCHTLPTIHGMISFLASYKKIDTVI